MTSLEYLTSKKITPVIRIVAGSNKAEAFVTMTIEQFEEYGKYCAEIAFDDGFNLGFIDCQRPSFDEWWSEFQKKEETK